MSFTLAMYFKPAYQKRYGTCACCNQGIVAGEKIMIGTGYWNGHLIKNHNHFDCWLQEMLTKTKDWFFKNEYKPIAMAPETKAKLNRLRAKRYYITKKGGEPNEVLIKLAEVERQIALAKANSG